MAVLLQRLLISEKTEAATNPVFSESARVNGGVKGTVKRADLLVLQRCDGQNIDKKGDGFIYLVCR